MVGVAGGVWRVLALSYVILYDTLYNRARNKRARTRGSGNAYKALSRVPAPCWRRFGRVGGLLSRKYIKSRGGALKCDYGSFELFGAGGREQKKAAPAARIPPGLLFLLPVGLVFPGGVVALDLLPDGAAYKGIDGLAALGCMGFDRVPAPCRERQRQPVQVRGVPFGIVALFCLADGHFSPPFHRPPL